MVQEAVSLARLSQGELESYHRDGYVVPRYRLQGEALARLQRLMATLAEENPQLIDQPIPGPHVPGSGVQGLKAGPGWAGLATHAPILDMVEQIVGPDIVLWGSTVFYKRALEGPETPWHRDGAYWPIEPLATTSVWIAATESKVENGCLRVIAGSHAKRQLGQTIVSERSGLGFNFSLGADEVDESQARDVELEPGQMVIFDVYSVHGARPNRGTLPRAGYALRFMPSTSHYHHDAARDRDAPGNAHHTRPLMLVRGIDRCGLNDFRRGHPNLAA